MFFFDNMQSWTRLKNEIFKEKIEIPNKPDKDFATSSDLVAEEKAPHCTGLPSR